MQRHPGKWRFKYQFNLIDTWQSGDLSKAGAIGPKNKCK